MLNISGLLKDQIDQMCYSRRCCRVMAYMLLTQHKIRITEKHGYDFFFLMTVKSRVNSYNIRFLLELKNVIRQHFDMYCHIVSGIILRLNLECEEGILSIWNCKSCTVKKGKCFFIHEHVI